MRRARNSAGFTLAELIVAMALFGLVMSTMVMLQAASFRSLHKNMDALVLDGNEVMLTSTLKKYLSGATFVEIPSTGSFSTSQLMVWQNINPVDHSVISPDPAAPVTGGYFCIDGNGDVYLYTVAAYPIDPSVTAAGACSKVEAGVTPVLLAGGLNNNLTVMAQFSRPAGANDVLTVQYELDYQPPSAAGVLISTGSFQSEIRGAM